MGWKGTLRSVNAAANKAARETQATQRAQERARNQFLSRVEKSSEAITKKASAFDAALSRDLIKALSLRYDPESGITSQPFEISTPAFEGAISVTSSSGDDTAFEPASFETGTATVTPLALLLTQWASVIAFRVAHSQDDYRLKLNWLKKSDPQSSSVYLLDADNSEYYYPVSTDLRGEVLPGHPRVGLIAFEPFRRPTQHVQVHFSSVKLSSKRGDSNSFHFDVLGDDLGGQIQAANEQPTVPETVEKLLAEEQEKAAQLVAESNKSGCAGVLLALFTIALMSAALLQFVSL